MQTDDIFWIASMTKPIAAVAIGILKDEGKLSFDDPVQKYLPEFANLMVGPPRQLNNQLLQRPITLRDVLTHTSGLGEVTSREPHMTLADLSKRLAQTSLQFQPGTRWQYSTAGIDILGRVVEVRGLEASEEVLIRLGPAHGRTSPRRAEAIRRESCTRSTRSASDGVETVTGSRHGARSSARRSLASGSSPERIATCRRPALLGRWRARALPLAAQTTPVGGLSACRGPHFPDRAGARAVTYTADGPQGFTNPRDQHPHQVSYTAA